MIKVRLNRQSYQYDVHSLVRAFYPQHDVKVDLCPETACGTLPAADAGREDMASDPIQPVFSLDVFFVPVCCASDPAAGVFSGTENFSAQMSEEASENAGESAAAAMATHRIILRLYEDTAEKLYMESPCREEDRHETKNELKRLLYRLLSEYSGRTLPWGDLTGIRPTKIPMALLNQGWKNGAIADYMRKTYYTSNEKTALSIAIANREHYLLEKLKPRNHASQADGRPAFRDGYSLYVGIPFCPSICLYCSFSSSPIALWKDKVDDYLDALMHEIEEVAAMVPHRCPDTIYIGGGTPTTLEPEQMRRLLAKLEEHFDLRGALEFTIEAGRPDSITREKLQVMKDFGVTRISINPQTMNQETLDFIGRKHTTVQTMEAFSLARDMGFDNINMDLIVGLPGEGEPEVEHTMQVLRGMNPDSITVHSLAVKRAARLRLFKEEHQELTFENSSEIMDMTARYAREAGLFPYYLYRQKNMAGNFENVGYAREGCEGLYNILIMEEIQSIIALGAGASTKLVRDGAAQIQEGKDHHRSVSTQSISGTEAAQHSAQPPEKRIERIENVKDIRNYIDRIDEMIERKRCGLYE
ncbi:MAG: coproporphyrinogen dehydrogenase HemZ [Clostridiales bacterium]|nr:coproporphyrinogen dehydrogenase HemZ [Clostridiales bacterium]